MENLMDHPEKMAPLKCLAATKGVHTKRACFDKLPTMASNGYQVYMPMLCAKTRKVAEILQTIFLPHMLFAILNEN